MAFNNGKWEFEDGSVQKQMNGLMNKDNPYMKSARNNGMKASGRRGLLNSSMGGQAGEEAALAAALPIAQQDASQINTNNQKQMEINYHSGRDQLNVASNDREKAMSAAIANMQSYNQMMANVMNNKDIPSDTRNKYFEHFGNVNTASKALIEQMYGIQLEWPTLQVNA